jgi:hypothetical protein
MPNANIYFSEEEDEKIRRLAAKWGVSKQQTVKRIVLKYKESKEVSRERQ